MAEISHQYNCKETDVVTTLGWFVVTMVTIPQLSASGDTSVCLWDIVGEGLLTPFKAHTGSVKSVDVKSDEPSES